MVCAGTSPRGCAPMDATDLQESTRTTGTRPREGRPAGDRRRRLLVGLIAANPGVHVTRAAAILGLHWNACWHHVRRLEREGDIVVRRHGGKLCLFERKAGSS